MKKIIFSIVLCVAASLPSMAQDGAVKVDSTNGYRFTPVKEIACTAPKDQSSSGTCWSFSGLGFLESEAMRNGREAVDLSPMWVVRHTYLEKAIKYVRVHGNGNFGGGGATHDVLNIVDKYGIVPQDVYTGLNYGTPAHKHGELDAVLLGYVKAVVSNPNRQLSTAWIDGVNGILDAYLGKVPEKFTYNGKEYTPQSFVKYLGLDMNDYVSLTSFTHHPFYTQFALEIPDNWAWGLSYNIPLDEFEVLCESAVNGGYSIFWATDVSEKGFKYKDGYAIVADEAVVESKVGTEESKWVKDVDGKKITTKTKPVAEPAKELTITQEMRQQAFDNYLTTDDHGMQIVGLAKDQLGNRYFKVKNSWGTSQRFGGYLYASVPFVMYKTTSLVVNKKAITAQLRNKLGIK